MNPPAEIRAPRLVCAPTASSAVIRCTDDDRLLQSAAISVLFFYPRRLNEEALAAGLRQALGAVPAFAGRIDPARGPLQIVCNNRGVSFSTATRALTLVEAIAGSDRGDGGGLVEEVRPGAARTQQAPLMTVRLSQLADGPMVLGCSWHHSVGDMHSFMLLMRAWAAAVAGTAVSPALIVEDRPAWLDAKIPAGGQGDSGLRRLAWYELLAFAAWLRWKGHEKQMAQVFFSSAELSRMVAAFSAASGQRLSTNDVLCAHLLAVLRGCEGRSAAARGRGISVAVNYRRQAGLDPALLGNLISFVHLVSPGSEEPEALAARLRGALNHFARDHLHYHARRRFIGGLESPALLKRCASTTFDVRKDLLITNWSRFGVYDVAMDGVTPLHFAPTGKSPLPWLSILVEGFGNQGLLFSGVFPPRVVARLSSPEGRARLHRFRQPDDPVPDLLPALPAIL